MVLLDGLAFPVVPVVPMDPLPLMLGLGFGKGGCLGGMGLFEGVPGAFLMVPEALSGLWLRAVGALGAFEKFG